MRSCLRRVISGVSVVGNLSGKIVFTVKGGQRWNSLLCTQQIRLCVCVCVCVCLYVAHTYLHTCTSCMYHSYQLRGLSLEECIQRQAVSIADETFR